MNRRDEKVLLKIQEEALEIADFISGHDCDSFIKDEKTKKAVCMTLINIGELVKNLSEDFRLANKHIPWKSIAGLRDIAVHGYQTLRMADIWVNAIEDVPVFLTQIGKILNEEKTH
jgi:uncharacterized protein with HEPN domain